MIRPAAIILYLPRPPPTDKDTGTLIVVGGHYLARFGRRLVKLAKSPFRCRRPTRCTFAGPRIITTSHPPLFRADRFQPLYREGSRALPLPLRYRSMSGFASSRSGIPRNKVALVSKPCPRTNAVTPPARYISPALFPCRFAAPSPHAHAPSGCPPRDARAAPSPRSPALHIAFRFTLPVGLTQLF